MILHGTPPSSEPERILLIQLRRIGDTILCTPAIRALAQAFPAAKIDFIAEQPAAEALAGHSHIERLLIPERHGWRDTLRFVRELRRVKYDWTIDFLSNPRSAQFAFASGAQFRFGFDRFGRRWAYTHRALETEEDLPKYAVDLRLEMLALIGIPAAGRHLEIFADQADSAATARVNEVLQNVPASSPMVALAAGGWVDEKRYPAHLTAELAILLSTANYFPVVTLGPGEHEFEKKLRALLPAKIPLLNEARVSTIAALCRRATLYIGPDSAPKHIAVACKIPTVTIFGPGLPSNWNDPQNPANVVLFPDCADRPNCVGSACAAKKCIHRVTPTSILEQAKRLLV